MLVAPLHRNLQCVAAGQDRRKLKVKEPQKYGWKPKELLTQISQVYMRIGRADSTGAFAEAIAADKRSYSEDLFPETMQVSVLLCLVDKVLRRWHCQPCTAASEPSLVRACQLTSTASTQFCFNVDLESAAVSCQHTSLPTGARLQAAWDVLHQHCMLHVLASCEGSLNKYDASG